MSVTLRIPTPLRRYTDGEGRIAVSAGTVGEAFGELADRYPDLRQHLFDDDGRLRNFVNAYLNEEDVRELDGEETPVSDGDTVVIVPSIAGGADGPRGRRYVPGPDAGSRLRSSGSRTRHTFAAIRR